MKRLDYPLSEVAIEEVSAIQDQLWQARPGRDLPFTEKVESVIDRLRALPESREARLELGADIRGVPLWRYVIFRRLAEDVLIVDMLFTGPATLRRLFEHTSSWV
jgi:plasmid stabilization system protein ParE